MKACLPRKISLCLVLVVLLLVCPQNAFAQEARLADIILNNTRDDLLLYLKVEGAFTPEIEEAILSGVPTSFSFFITLLQVRNMWFDRELADLEVTHTVKYNNLKKEFVIQRSWENGPPMVTQSFAEAKKLLSEVASLKIIPLAKLEKGGLYQIRAKAELSRITLPFHLHHILFFISLWDFETDWYTIDFTY